MERRIDVRLSLSYEPRVLRPWLVFCLLLLCAADLASENVTLTTYYPAPSGMYTQLITTQQTILARDSGNVGIGTASPGKKLDVTGDIRSSGEMIGTLASGIGQFRAVAGNYGAFIRNDGSNTYMPLLTASGDQYGGWNALRPLRVDNVSGDLYMANSQVRILHASGDVATAGNIIAAKINPNCSWEAFGNGGQTNCSGGKNAVGINYNNGWYATTIVTSDGQSYPVAQGFSTGWMLCCNIAP